MLFHSSGAGCHCSTDLGEEEKVGAEQCRWVPACQEDGGAARACSSVAILHGNLQDPADVPARLLKFPLCQVDKCARDVSPEYLRRRLWPHRLLQSEDLLASHAAVDAMLP